MATPAQVLLAAGVACLFVGEARAFAQNEDAPRTVFLNFADGDDGLGAADRDDATMNRSQLCEAPRIGRWLGAQGCGDREACRQAILEATADLWSPFNVTFTATRPTEGPYTMVIVGPPTAQCGFGVDGAAPLDCEDQNASSVAFAFACASDVTSCAHIIAQEVAHGFGLAHVVTPCDLMAANGPVCPSAAFRDEQSFVDGVSCAGVRVQNSYQELLTRVGPRAAETPLVARQETAAGCSVAGSSDGRATLALACLLAWAARKKPLPQLLRRR